MIAKELLWSRWNSTMWSVKSRGTRREITSQPWPTIFRLPARSWSIVWAVLLQQGHSPNRKVSFSLLVSTLQSLISSLVHIFKSFSTTFRNSKSSRNSNREPNGFRQSVSTQAEIISFWELMIGKSCGMTLIWAANLTRILNIMKRQSEMYNFLKNTPCLRAAVMTEVSTFSTVWSIMI